MTGIAVLDSAIGGFETGELIVISGPRSMGKTLLCDTIIRNLRRHSEFSLFFTFEVTPEKIVENHSTPDSVVFLPLQHKPMDLSWLKDRCWEAKTKYGCTTVFIDHLHYIVDMATRNNMSLEIGQTMRTLKREIALGLDMAVFLVCHVGKLNLETEPSIYHLRDSSFVAQESDTVLMVWRRFDKGFDGKTLDTMLQGLAIIKLEKAKRTGRMGAGLLICSHEAHCISDWGHDFRPDYLRLGPVIERLGHPVVLAMTATASPRVREEIAQRLNLRKPRTFVHGFDRPNIYLRVDHFADQQEKVEGLVHRVRWSEKPGLIYVATRKHAEEIMRLLAEEGVKALFYHGG